MAGGADSYLDSQARQRAWGSLREFGRMCVFFFFFQAEDGIRDVAVTGVQTCALPISTALTCSTRSPFYDANFCRTSTSMPLTTSDSSRRRLPGSASGRGVNEPGT